PFPLAGNANLDIPEFAVLDRAYDGRKGPPQRMFDMARTRLTTGISLDARRIALPGAMLDVDGSRVAVDGALHFDSRLGLDLAATSDSLSLAALRGHVGTLTWDGTVFALNGRVYGPYGSPRIEGGAGIRDFRMLDLSLGNVSGDARFEDLPLARPGPASRPDGEATVTCADLNGFGQNSPEGDARATLHGKEPRLRIEDLTLRRGNGTVTLAGDFGPDYQLEMDAQSHGLTLHDVDVAKAARMQGPLESSVRIRGVASHPRVEAKASFAGARA